MAYPSDEEWAASLYALGENPGAQRCTEALTPASGPVCVTGANGFIALHLVTQLLEKGYNVVGTVRSMGNAKKMAPLVDLQAKFGKDKLRIVGGVDCLKAETFDEAVAGCVGIFHTASPFNFSSNDPLKDLVPPAIEGTVAALAAAKKAGTVKRVIVTSSFASVMNFGHPKYPMSYGYSDKDWNVLSRPDQSGKFPEPVPAHGYRYSKLMAEKAAWEFTAQNDCAFDVVMIMPPMVIGHNFNRPESVDDLNTSSGVLRKILIGTEPVKPNSMAWVDVADAAGAHILSYEHPEAGGKRFLCAGEVPLWHEVAQWLKEMYPSQPIQTDAPKDGVGVYMTVDNSRLKSMGMKFRPLKETLKAQADSLLNLGLAKL